MATVFLICAVVGGTILVAQFVLTLVGLGGGVVVKNYAPEGWNIDAVEIDPTVTELALEYFGITKKDANYYDTDGRQFLIEHDRKYDLIIMDAFGSSFIPFHLVTTENFELTKKHLKSDGMLGINVISLGWEGTVVKSICATLQEHFSEVYVLPLWLQTEPTGA